MNWLARWLVDDVDGYRFNDPDDTVDGRNDMTIRQMLYYIITAKRGISFGADIGTLDGKIDTWKPKLAVFAGDNGRTVVRYILQRASQCVLVPYQNQLRLKVVRETDDLDYTYVTPSEL